MNPIASDVARARAWAEQAHADQKYGLDPYLVHLDEVDAVLNRFGFDDPAQRIVGYLHDTIEDTPATRAGVSAEFGSDVAEAVQFCTDEKGPNRKTRKRLTYRRMAGQRSMLEAHAEAPEYRFVHWGILAKLADRIANVERAFRDANEGLIRMYRAEKDMFRTALFIEGMADAMWARFDALWALQETNDG